MIELIVKAYKYGDFAFVYFTEKDDLYKKMDALTDAGFRLEPCTKEEEERIIQERCHEDTTPIMMQRVEEISKIFGHGYTND